MPNILPTLLLSTLVFLLHQSPIADGSNVRRRTNQLSIDQRERHLRIKAYYLHRLEKHLRQREDYLRRYCPHPTKPSTAKLCEFCEAGIKCSPGLSCRDRKCQRVKGRNAIACSDDESCGPGQQRRCGKIGPSVFQKPGVLQDKLSAAGFFIGKTNVIPNCVMGKVRFSCKKRPSICGREFCITMTLKECREEGLFKGDLRGRDNDLCCVKAVPVDCVETKLCRCVAKK